MSLSVVIPAYNSANFIAETLRSVLAQTLPPDEILVIDDGSTDNTAEVAGQFGPPVQVIRRQNAKQAASRNFGVQQATSEWIAFVDADDLWEPDKLQRQMEELQRHPDATICYTARVEILQEGETTRRGNVIPVPPADQIQQALFRNTTFLPSSVVVRRSAFLDAGGFNPHYTIVEDWDLWLRMLQAGNHFAACREPLLLYRIHANSMSHKALTVLREKNEIYESLVLPQQPSAQRRQKLNQSSSEHESCAAYVLRDVGDRRCIPMMARSITRSPFYEPIRYLALAHMIFARLRGKMSATSS